VDRDTEPRQAAELDEQAASADRGSRCSLRPLSAVVDMTSTVKYHRDAGIRPSLGLVADFMEAVVIDTTRDELWGGGYRDSAPLGDRRL